jgi:hypothetical protein
MIRRDNFIAFFNSTGIKIIEKDFEGAISSNMVDYYLGDIIKNYSTEACSILNEYDVRQEIGMNSDPYPPIFYAFLILFGDQIVTHFGDRAKVLDLQATIYKEIQALNNQELSLFTSKRIQSWIDSMLLTEQQIEPSFQEKQHMLTLQGMDPALLATIFNKLSMY